MKNSFGFSSVCPVPSGVTAAAGHIAREIGLVDIVNQMVPWDEQQCHLSPGERLLALVIGILYDRTALWRMHEVLADQDLPVLFRPGVVATDFHDDALARALDKLARANPEHVFATLTARALAQEGRSWSDLSVIHADTTSVSVWGEYEATAKASLAIRHGYSKQQRPDLKQFGIGLLATSEGIPVRATIHNGNLDDKTWNHQTLDRIQKEFTAAELDHWLYVADSALLTTLNLRKMHDMTLRFVSRLPDSFGVTAQLQEEAWQQGEWTEVGTLSPRKQAAQYRIQERSCEIDGQAYRAVVVFSSSLDTQKLKTLERKRAQQEAELQEAAERLGRESFGCCDDAQRAARALADAHERGLWGLTWSVASEEPPVKRTKRGRPKKGEVLPTVTQWRVHATPTLRTDRYEAARRRAGTFVLLSNDTRRSADELLRAYKGQQNGVEIPFRVLKALPIAPVFLKSPERVAAFAWVVLMAYLVYAIMQYRVRSALRAQHDTLVTPGGLPSATPTAQSILDMLGTIQTILLHLPTGLIHRQLHSVNPHVPKLLELLRVPQTAYTVPSG